MSTTERGDGAEHDDSNQNRSEQNLSEQTHAELTSPTHTHADQTMVPVARTPEAAADRLAREFAQESRLRILRSKAAVARSDVDALAAIHLDPDTLEELLDSADPIEAERLRRTEQEISARVARARAKAEAAEAEYEQAVLDDFDEAER